MFRDLYSNSLSNLYSLADQVEVGVEEDKMSSPLLLVALLLLWQTHVSARIR